MKTVLLFILLITSPLLFAQTTAIPDPNFEQALIDLGLDDVLDGEVLSANIDTVESLIVPNKNISELTGIEDFTSLVWLDCDSNQLTSLNISSNTNLEILSFNYNQLTTFTSHENIRVLWCAHNQLTELNLNESNSMLDSRLTHLGCSYNNLTYLDMSDPWIQYLLQVLDCSNNELTELNLEGFHSLCLLFCGSNNLYCLHLGCANYFWFSTPQAYIANNPNLQCVEIEFSACMGPEETWWTIAEWDEGLVFSSDNSCGTDCNAGLDALNSSPKTLTQILDLVGRETTFKPNTPLIYVYDDGSTERVFAIEE